MTPKFRLVLPGLWRPPFTIASLRDVVINEVPLGCVDPDKYGTRDLLEFLNETQKLIHKTDQAVSLPSATIQDKSTGLYVVSRLQLEIAEVIKSFSMKYPDFVITLDFRSNGSYTVFPKAFVNAPRRLS